VAALTAAFGRNDRAGLPAVLAEGVVLRVPPSVPYGGQFDGRPAFLAWFDGLTEVYFSALNYHLQSLTQASDRVLVQVRLTVASRPQEPGLSAELAVEQAWVFQLDSDGLICAATLYGDTAAVRDLLAGVVAQPVGSGSTAVVSVERHGQLLLIGLNRPAKRNAFSQQLVDELSAAYTLLDADPQLRCGVLHAAGQDFTAGLDLAYFAGRWAAGHNPFAPLHGRVDPWGLLGEARRTPVVAAAQGRCYTLGIELLLAADVRVAARGTRFAQLEVQRGIYPVGGATMRLATEIGYGNAMRWLLTGEEYDAAEGVASFRERRAAVFTGR
jgi:ketosteroid isomerase-like protein